MKAKRKRKLTVNEMRKIIARMSRSLQAEQGGGTNEFDRFMHKLITGTVTNNDKDVWFLCNSILNMLRDAAGVPLRSWRENPYLGGNKDIW